MIEIIDEKKTYDQLKAVCDFVTEETALDYRAEYYRLLEELKHKNKIIKNLKAACYSLTSVLYEEMEV